jgi:hypothetical protein
MRQRDKERGGIGGVDKERVRFAPSFVVSRRAAATPWGASLVLRVDSCCGLQI